MRPAALKVKTLIGEMADLCSTLDLSFVEEYRTEDDTRIDLALFKAGRPLIAVEFERTYKWIRRRILYNAVKAYRAGFPRLLVVYPFNSDGIERSWVFAFSAKELTVDIQLTHPDEALAKLPEMIRGERSTG